MHGNRDFLIGKDFLSKTGIELLKEPTIFSYKNNRIMLSHGDTFCIDDVEYQAFRKVVRSQEWQRNFLNFPIDKRLEILNEARDASIQSQQMKSNDIMDVNKSEVATVIQQNNIDVLIHGHTHRPYSHKIDVDRKQSVRLVLGDWSVSTAKIVEWINAEPKLIDLIN
jgi:UDP-2,3-diacylglucosamine hydrolase